MCVCVCVCVYVCMCYFRDEYKSVSKINDRRRPSLSCF